MIPWGTFPFNDDLKKLAGQMDPGDVHSYVNDMMKKFMPAQPNNLSSQHNDDTSTSGNDHNSELNARVFETFDDVFIRIDLPDDDAHQRIRIFYTSNQTIVENIHGDDKRHVITLPLVKEREPLRNARTKS